MADCPLAAVLTTAAVRLGEPDLALLAAGLSAPVRVRVGGRPGAGVRAVVRAVRTAGVTICGPDEDPDVDVRVINDGLTDADGRPDLAVLETADPIGSAAVAARCREIRRRTGVTAVALSSPVAAAAFDPGVTDEDLSRIAAATGAAPAGADRIAVRTALRRASGVDAVRAAIDRAAAPVRYRRIDAALTELASRATGADGARLAVLLAGDDVVLSRMVAAAEVLRESGLPVPPVPADPLAAAIRWRRYTDGPVSDLHRACAADLSRGALRLWDRRPAAAARPRPASVRTAGLRQSRIEAAASVRSGCATLRAELQSGAAETSRAEAFVRRARHRITGVAAEADAEITRLLAAAGFGPDDWPDPPMAPEEPPLRPTALEGRLTALLGVMVGAGAALTLGRALTGLVPGWSAAIATGCAVIGLTISGWVVRVRRVLSERAAADRWVAEMTAALRSMLEDRVTARFAAAEVTLLTSAPFGGSRPG